MIKNFDEFYAAIKASNFTMGPEHLTIAEQVVLKSLVSIDPEGKLQNAGTILMDFYGMFLPSQFLVEVLQENLDLAMETFTDGIGDTCQRELLVDAVLKKLGMRSWPINGDGDAAFNEFVSVLKERITTVGGTMVS